MRDDDQVEDPRSFLAARLDELITAAGAPPLNRIAPRQQMGPGVNQVTANRISAWKKGENVPHTFELLIAVVRILIKRARTRATADHMTNGLLDESHWHRWWTEAKRAPTKGVRMDRTHRTGRSSVGQPIKDILDPHDLEIHPAIQPSAASALLPSLTPYIPRKHDHQLRELVAAAQERSAVAMLVGESSTGKTRACWEAVRMLPREWRLWHPISPGRPEALLDALNANAIAPWTVIWLNDAHFYLDTSASDAGERIAASLRDLIRSPSRGPVLVLGTLWPYYWEVLSHYPRTGEADAHSQARALMAARNIAVPERFGKEDISALCKIASCDARMAEAAKRSDGKVTQFLAGGFEILNQFESAAIGPRTVITAALDIGRLTKIDQVSEPFLRTAVSGYFDDETWNGLEDDWFEKGLEYASRPCLGVPGPLTRIRPRPGQSEPSPLTYKISDFLAQNCRSTRRYDIPPHTFWDAAVHAFAIDDLLNLAHEAQSRGRFRYAANLYLRAAEKGSLESLVVLAEHRRAVKDYDAAYQLLNEAAARGHVDAWEVLAGFQESAGNLEAAEQLLMRAGSNAGALAARARLRSLAGDVSAARGLLDQAIGLGSKYAMRELAKKLEEDGGNASQIKELREQAGPIDYVDELRKAAGNLRVAQRELDNHEEELVKLGSINEQTLNEAREIARRSIGEEDPWFWVIIGRIERNCGLAASAEVTFRKALDAGSMARDGTNRPLIMLAEIVEESGDRDAAQRLLKYGLELDGTISHPWAISMDAHSGRSTVQAQHRS